MNPNAKATKVIKRAVDFGYRPYVAWNRLWGRIDFPVPTFSGMNKTSSKSIRHYYESGIRTAMPIITSAIEHSGPIDNKSILDFGCGVGRQLLHFTKHLPNNKFYGCDVDDTAVAWVTENYPQVAAYTSSFKPPLVYDDGMFDLIYSVSIFSHLQEKDLSPWLGELARITKPGGLILLTTEGRTALGQLADTFGGSHQQLEIQLEQSGFLYKEYDYLKDAVETQGVLRAASLMLGIKDSYGNTVLSRKYIDKHWNNDMVEVVAVVEGIIDFRQDLVILRRKA